MIHRNASHQIVRLVSGLLALSLFITGCESVAAAQSAATPNAQSIEVKDIAATGKVVPAQKAMLSFALPGQVVELRVDVGSVVKQGNVIAQLDTAALDAEVAKAQTALAFAQASLDRVKAGPRSEQVAEAKSNLEAANAGVAQAAANRDQVKSGATQTEIDNAKAAVQQAYIEMVQARTKHDLLQQDHDKHKAGQEQVDDAFKQYQIADTNLKAAQARLEKLLSGADTDTLRVAQAQLGAASADYQAQQAQVDLLLAGARPEDIAVYEANGAQAKAALDLARLARDKAELVAPFDGTVAEVYIRQSQYVNAGAPVVLIADLAGLRAETTDLSEKDIAGVAIGDKAILTFDALPGVSVDGAVTQIAPKGEQSTGVNYTVTIDLNQLPERVRWGMTALVDIPRDQ